MTKIDNLLKVIKADSYSLLYSLELHLKKHNYNIISHYPYYVIGQGNIPILLVAHVDTVHNQPPSEIFYDEKQQVLWSPDGLGADDRAGVYAILELINRGYKPHVLFTNYEESGAQGSNTLIKDYPTIPKIIQDTKYVIQLDRRNKNDCVFYNCNNIKFISYIEDFGFTEANGSFTDISIFCPVWKIAGANLSVGYYREHSTNEYLKILELEATINKVEEMLKNPPTNIFEYIEKENKYNYISSYSHSYAYKIDICYFCYRQFETEMLIEVPEYEMLLCPECYTRLMNTCENCKKEFYDPAHLSKLCDDCKKTKKEEENI